MIRIDGFYLLCDPRMPTGNGCGVARLCGADGRVASFMFMLVGTGETAETHTLDHWQSPCEELVEGNDSVQITDQARTDVLFT